MDMPAGMPSEVMPEGTPSFSRFTSVMTACVVSMMPAMPQALERPERVTLAGSRMPLSSRFSTLPSIALYPYSQDSPFSFSITTSPSTPLLNAISLSGAVIAFITMSAPKRSSSLVSVALNSGTICDRWKRAAPPPGTMPSSTAAKVAFLASSMRSLRSSSSASVAAPTLMTAMPPVSFAMRSLSFSMSYVLSLFSSSFLI
mmetsp:Transcript_5439/g.9771  ORF Transcript_5439/g.9771 Transcript_5439/m.9771 type:complete len:201 (-) Transcript_5439:1408-2010(-)